MSSPAFDRIVLLRDGGRDSLTVEQFFALPLHERIRFILQRQIEFFDGPIMVDRGEALRALSGWSKQKLSGP